MVIESMSKDFKNGKIYCIRNNITNDIYVGSTCQPLSKRMAKHRETRTDPNKQHHKIHSKMNELGVENFYIELIEEYPCENNDQLRAREGHFIREMATLNGRIECRDRKEHYQDNKEYIKAKSNKNYYDNIEYRRAKNKEYRDNHKEERVEYDKQYRQDNKERIAQYKKDYREKNRDTILQKHKEYHEQHKEEQNQKRREFYQDHKEEINRKRREKRQQAKEQQMN